MVPIDSKMESKQKYVFLRKWFDFTLLQQEKVTFGRNI
jgi:hypothetical protein